MDKEELSAALCRKALSLGASLAGIANIEDLKRMPSFRMMPLRPHIDRVGVVPNETGLPEGVVNWPEGMRSVLVVALFHPEDRRELDFWLDEKNPPGNIELIRIMRGMKEWLTGAYPSVSAIPMGYYVERGGIWLKDAAALAGLGVIGRSNLLVTKEYGPRVRLRAMYISEELPSTGVPAWDPCEDCDMPCRKACPQNSFAETMYRAEDYEGLTALPGRTGCYDLRKCDRQMAADEGAIQRGEIRIEGFGTFRSCLSYCRECELNCRIGRKTEG